MLKGQFLNTYKYSDHDNNKLTLLLQKGVYLYIWMIGKNSMKHHYLKKKKDFYGHLNMEDITPDCTHRKSLERF